MVAYLLRFAGMPRSIMAESITGNIMDQFQEADVPRKDKFNFQPDSMPAILVPGFQKRSAELLAYARGQGLNFVVPSPEDLEATVTFLRSHPLVVAPNRWRRHRLENVQVVLEDEFLKIDAFVDSIKKGIFDPGILRSMRHADVLKERLDNVIELAKQVIRNVSGMISPACVPSDAGGVGGADGFNGMRAAGGAGGARVEAGEERLVRESSRNTSHGNFGGTSEAFLQLQLSCSSLKRFLRYMLDQYHSGRFSVDFVAAVLGFANPEELLWRFDGARRSIIDFGCGNGDLLIELARTARRRERGREILSIMEDLLEDFGFYVNFANVSIKRKIHDEFIYFLESSEIIIPRSLEPTDPHLIGLDEAQLTLEELQCTHGISTKMADVCDPHFFAHTGLAREEAGVVISILTLDRVPDLDRFLQNFADSLEPNGRFLLANKGIIDTRSDGEGVTILYRSENDLKSDTYTGTLEKLRPKLVRFGLGIESVSLHPYAVISTEGVQHYDLVVVGGRKKN